MWVEEKKRSNVIIRKTDNNNSSSRNTGRNSSSKSSNNSTIQIRQKQYSSGPGGLGWGGLGKDLGWRGTWLG